MAGRRSAISRGTKRKTYNPELHEKIWLREMKELKKLYPEEFEKTLGGYLLSRNRRKT